MPTAPPTLPNPSALPLALQSDQMTPTAIKQRFVGNFRAIRPDASARTGGLLDTFAGMFATEYAQILPALGRSMNNTFAQTAQDARFILARAAEQGLAPTPAVPAVVPFTFSAPVGTVYPQGTRIGVSSLTGALPVVFATDASVTVPGGGSVTVSATCTVAGSVGNISAGASLFPIDPVAGTSALSNGDPTTLGEDEQSTASLLLEYLNFWENQPTSGNPSQYYGWAFAADPGVGGAVITRTPGIIEVQSLVDTGASAGTFTLTFGGQTTGAIAYNASAATVATALNALSSITAAGGVACTGGALPAAVTITFLTVGAQPLITTSGATGLTGGTAVVTRTTAGAPTAGSVGISLLGTAGLPASGGVVTAVTNYITPTLIAGQGQGAIGPTDLSIYAAPSTSIAVVVTVTYDTGIVPSELTSAQVNANVKAALIAYYANIAFAGSNSTLAGADALNDVDPAKIAGLIGGTRGIASYTLSSLTVNGGTAIVAIARDHVAIHGSLTINGVSVP